MHSSKQIHSTCEKSPLHIFHSHTFCVSLCVCVFFFALWQREIQLRFHSHIFATLILFMIVFLQDCMVCVLFVSFMPLSSMGRVASWSTLFPHTSSSLHFFSCYSVRRVFRGSEIGVLANNNSHREWNHFGFLELNLLKCDRIYWNIIIHRCTKYRRKQRYLECGLCCWCFCHFVAGLKRPHMADGRINSLHLTYWSFITVSHFHISLLWLWDFLLCCTAFLCGVCGFWFGFGWHRLLFNVPVHL